jgi:hypothetical protein
VELCRSVVSNLTDDETRTERVLRLGVAGAMRRADRGVGRAAETVAAADSPRGSLGSSPIGQIPLDGCLQASGKFGVCMPTEGCVGSCGVHASAWLAIGLGCIPHQVASEADEAGNRFHSFANRDFAIVAKVKRFTAVV